LPAKTATAASASHNAVSADRQICAHPELTSRARLRCMPDREHHSHIVGGVRHHWWTDRLWARSANLPIEEVTIDSIVEFDMDCWFRGTAPTCRQVADHARRINEADLSHPVIFSSDGQLMDGGHRIAKAYLLGLNNVAARRFTVDPEPDWVDPPSH
jgi:hypothetical protein